MGRRPLAAVRGRRGNSALVWHRPEPVPVVRPHADEGRQGLPPGVGFGRGRSPGDELRRLLRVAARADHANGLAACGPGCTAGQRKRDASGFGPSVTAGLCSDWCDTASSSPTPSTRRLLDGVDCDSPRRRAGPSRRLAPHRLPAPRRPVRGGAPRKCWR